MAGECAVERDGGNGGRAPARALFRVTDASGDEGSGWSLQTLDHGRRDTANHEGSEAVSQFDRGENEVLRRHGCARAARGTGAAFVQAALGNHRLACGRVIDGARMGMSKALPHSISVARAAGDHRHRSEALHRQSDCQQDHQSETNKTLHLESLSDRRPTRRRVPKCFGKKPAWQAVRRTQVRCTRFRVRVRVRTMRSASPTT